MLRKVIGWSMIVALFVEFFVFVATTISMMEALKIFGFAALVVIWVAIATHLTARP